MRNLALAAAVALLVVITLVAPRDAVAAPAPASTWAPAAPPPSFMTDRAVRLADGRVLLTHVFNYYLGGVYNPATDTWTYTGTSQAARIGHSLTLLNDGNVLAAGGMALTMGGPETAAELWDPGTNNWTITTGPMVEPGLEQHSATKLTDGRVLLVGGIANDIYRTATEIYDPGTGTFASAASMGSPRAGHGTVLLPSGDVLVVGGFNGSSYITSAEVYDPDTNTWAPAGSVAANRYTRSPVLLPTGRVLVSGGVGVQLATAELYDPGSNTWSPAANMHRARQPAHALALADGTALVIGDHFGVDIGSPLPPASRDAEIYDPVTNTWKMTGSLVTDTLVTNATLLADGRVLGTGPTRSLNYKSEIFGLDADFDGYPDWKETALAENTALYCAIMRVDVDSNGTVNSADLGRVAARFFQSPIAPRFDQNANGIINAQDLGLVAQKFSQTVGSCP